MARAYGEGTVYRRDGGWEAALIVHGRRRTTRAKTARAAREKLRELHRKALDDDFVQAERTTVSEFLEYRLTVVESTIRPSTHKRYREYVRVHAVPEIGHLRLVELTPMHLQRLYANRLQAGSSASTVKHLHRTLHRALAMAERWEQVNRNVARLVTPPRVTCLFNLWDPGNALTTVVGGRLVPSVEPVSAYLKAGTGGYSGWHLPTLKDWQKLVSKTLDGSGAPSGWTRTPELRPGPTPSRSPP